MKVEVAVLDSSSPISLMVPVEVKQHRISQNRPDIIVLADMTGRKTPSYLLTYFSSLSLAFYVVFGRHVVFGRLCYKPLVDLSFLYHICKTVIVFRRLSVI